jgi:hypothetical protein
MSEQRAFVLSAIGAALVVPALAFGLVQSGADRPPSPVTPAAANEPGALAPRASETELRVIRLAPMVITAQPARRVVREAALPSRGRTSVACDPEWRTLDQGPAGRHVRVLCR